MLDATQQLDPPRSGVLPLRAAAGRRSEKHEALDQLFRSHRNAIYASIYRIVRHSDDASGLVQETFLQALKSYESFRGNSRLSTWVCGIAINLARNFVHRRIRYRSLGRTGFGISEYATADIGQTDALIAMQRDEQSRLISAAVARLPEIYREVVILRDLEERPTREVATLLGLSEGNVRIRLHRGHRVLRKLLENDLAA